MPKYTYPLIKYKFEDGSEEELGLHPHIPIRITNPIDNISKRIYALVDTGADSCLFAGDLAEQLGHDLKGDGVKDSVNVGISQTDVPVYKHTFKVELLAPDERTAVWSSEDIEIDCIDASGLMLLGANDFLKHFSWEINYPDEKLIIKW